MQDITEFNMIGVPRPPADTRFLNCVPNEVFFMLDWGKLDINDDGYWSPAEAYALTEQYNQSQSEMTSTLSRMVFTLKASARMVQKMSQYEGNEDAMNQANEVRSMLEAANGSLPKSVYISQVEPFLRLCLLMDSRLCGNAVFRRSLNRSVFMNEFHMSAFHGSPLPFLELSPRTAGKFRDFTQACPIIIDIVCPSFFTVTYEEYSSKRKEVCGEPSTETLQLPASILTSGSDRMNQDVLVVDFAMFEQHSGQADIAYRLFLLLILLLWVIAMFEEYRTIIHWWRVLLGTPIDVTILEAQTDEERTVSMKDFTLCYRCLNIVFNLLPRTCIAIAILFFGARYLVLSQSYEELMMNSLALTFLVTIDEMIFVAFVSTKRREWLGNANPLEVKIHRGSDTMIACLLSECLLVPMLFITVIAYMSYEYNRTWGKDDVEEAFRCICQVSGQRCMAAQVVGGYPTVDDASAHDGEQ